MRLHWFWARVLVATFLLALIVPGVGMVAGWGLQDGREEKRTLTPPPSFGPGWAAKRAWPDAASHYFEDHFAFRSALVSWQAALRFRWLHVSPSSDVVVGQDGWLFYAGDGGDEDYASAVPFTDADLEQWRRTLQHTYDWLKARGIPYVFVIAPDKYAIYPEYLPASMHRVGRESRTDQLVRHLARTTNVPVLDLRPSLLAAKPAERLYHLTDTHWNERGAYVAYAAVLRALHQQGLAPLPRTAFVARAAHTTGMDLSAMMGLTAAMSEDDLQLRREGRRPWRVLEPDPCDPLYMEGRIVTVHEDANRPHAVIFRDSFGSALVPLLAEHFGRALYLWQYNFDPAVVTQERPAVVIQEWVGRRLATLLPYDAVGGDGSSEGTVVGSRN
jgi:alginate O-acetyltransferase complex protein AlgJ